MRIVRLKHIFENFSDHFQLFIPGQHNYPLSTFIYKSC